METKKIKEILIELLKLSDEFKTINDVDIKKPSFNLVLLAIARRDYPILHTISLLKDDELSGDAILDLSRRIFEDMIAVEFMIIKGKEEMSAKFIKYANVERWLDLEYLKKLGSKQDAKIEKEIEQNFNNVKTEFLFRGEEIARTWSKSTVENMIEELVKEKVIPEKDIPSLLQGYILGNRKNHLASRDAQFFLDSSQRAKDVVENPRIGMVIAIVAYIKILSRYASEIDDRDMAKRLEELFNRLMV